MIFNAICLLVLNGGGWGLEMFIVRIKQIRSNVFISEF